MTRWQEIARQGVGVDYAEAYAAQFRRSAARGQDIHGEATFVAAMLPAPGRVLDAGCGTGRITVRLDELGYTVVGVDADPPMLAVARADAPSLDWRLGDLAALDLGDRFDVVLLAGNIWPLLEPGTLEAVAAGLAGHLAEGGRVVSGFGLDAAHLPSGCPVTELRDVDAALAGVGLVVEERFSGWDRTPYDASAGYAVSVHGRG